MDRLKKFDAYPKYVEDFRVRTTSGAIITSVCGVLMLWLFVSELSFYLATDVRPDIIVDKSRNEKLRINFDIVFHNIPCSLMTVDAIDSAGDNQIDMMHDVKKKRIDSSGKQIDEAILPQSVNVKKQETAPSVSTPENKTADCGSCYGASSGCCNSCESVREAYKTKGWGFNPNNIEICVREGIASVNTEKLTGEGCQVFGFLHVNKVAGNFHFAPGKSQQHLSMHIHEFMPSVYGSMNFSHTINKLSFGEDFPGSFHPLNGAKKIATGGNAMYQYFVKIVPTSYTALKKQPIGTNQFSVTEHIKYNEMEADKGMPGVFFLYDLSPIKIEYKEERRSFAHFITGVCAIIGGVFTVAGLIDSGVYRGLRSLEKKIELGKVN